MTAVRPFPDDQYDVWGDPIRCTPAYLFKLRVDGRRRLDTGSARSAARYRRELRVHALAAVPFASSWVGRLSSRY